MSATDSRAIVMYARPPVEGRVKTRLQPGLSPAQALSLYEAMLSDGIERMTAFAAGSAVPFVSFSGECHAAGELARLLGTVRVEYQLGEDLGARMAHTVETRLREGFRQVVLLGSDSPNLPLDYLDQAFEALMAVDLVIGPAEDGGYYLLGARRLHRRLFQQVPWGTAGVLSVTRERIKSGHITCHELPTWYDIDTPASVARLQADLQRSRPGEDGPEPHRTRRVLAGLTA